MVRCRKDWLYDMGQDPKAKQSNSSVLHEPAKEGPAAALHNPLWEAQGHLM